MTLRVQAFNLQNGCSCLTDFIVGNLDTMLTAKIVGTYLWICDFLPGGLHFACSHANLGA